MNDKLPANEDIISTGGVVSPKGFKAAGTYCGIKNTKECFDLGIIFSERPCAGTAIFTTNQICAAPVKLGKKTIQGGRLRAFIINSGNANACTGEQGDEDAEEMAMLAAKCLNIPAGEILVSSTGIIGRPLPMDRITKGIKHASASLGNTHIHSDAVTRSIMTTDTNTKNIALKLRINDKEITLGGISKGAGMIAPNMATMLCFITTDAAIPASLLYTCLRESAESSFNRITIDGHMSTNDTLAIMANGASGQNITPDRPEQKIFQLGLNFITAYLAKAIVRDGEGATKFVQIDVTEAASRNDATKIARAIADSLLVKTAINGEDPNWGRIISAAGYAGVELEETKLILSINNIQLFARGMPVPCDHDQLCVEMKKKDILIRLSLGKGDYSDTVWTCDLSHEYVSINAEYHT